VHPPSYERNQYILSEGELTRVY